MLTRMHWDTIGRINGFHEYLLIFLVLLPNNHCDLHVYHREIRALCWENFNFRSMAKTTRQPTPSMYV